jgi:hypothetical protein
VPAVRRTAANTLAELSIGYPDSPLTQRGRHGQSGPAPGERAPILAGASPVGAGTTPRFALFAPHDPEGDALAARYHDLLEPDIRPPFSGEGIWLVRPDGYVALVTGHGHWAEVEAYLRRTAGG